MESMNLLPVPDFDGYYVDLELGEIYSDKGRIMRKLSHYPNEAGYLNVKMIRNDKKPIKMKVHRAVMAAYLGTWDWEKPYIDHKNSNKSKNCIENLTICTPKENINKEDVLEKRRGQGNGMAKLREEDVTRILEMYRNMVLGDRMKVRLFLQKMSDTFGVSFWSIRSIVNGNTWKHIDRENILGEERVI
jgi:hypothetical protein